MMHWQRHISAFLFLETISIFALGVHADQVSFRVPNPKHWDEKYGMQIDQTFSGPLSFSHLPYTRCLDDKGTLFDIAVLGLPFDTGVSYRPGARFGPYAIRSGSRRQRAARGYTLAWELNPYEAGFQIIDCGDVCFVFDIEESSVMYLSHRCPYRLTIMP